MLKNLFRISFLALAVSAIGQNTQRVDLDAVRKELADTYKTWGKTRVSLDRAMMEKMLAPDFYVQLAPDRKLTRAEFIDGNSKAQEGFKLTRFDSDILTVMIKKEITEVVITEKLEYEVKTPEGTTVTVYNYWVTRDGWTKKDGVWTAHYSEAIGAQGWRGTKPPIPNW